MQVCMSKPVSFDVCAYRSPGSWGQSSRSLLTWAPVLQRGVSGCLLERTLVAWQAGAQRWALVIQVEVTVALGYVSSVKLRCSPTVPFVHVTSGRLCTSQCTEPGTCALCSLKESCQLHKWGFISRAAEEKPRNSSLFYQGFPSWQFSFQKQEC